MKLEDNKIKDLVSSVQFEPPRAIERKINYAIKEALSRKQSKPRWFYKVLVPVAMGIIFALLMVYPPQKSNQPRKQQISEIRTEFHIKDKNIKIIWIQTNNFKLRRTKT